MNLFIKYSKVIDYSNNKVLTEAVTITVKPEASFSTVFKLLGKDEKRLVLPQIQSKIGSPSVKYIFRNGRYLLFLDYSECSVQEILDTYQIDFLEIIEPHEVGIVLPPFDLNVWVNNVMNVVSNIVNVVSLIEISRRLSKWMVNNLSIGKLNYIGVDCLERAVTSQNHWNIDDFCQKFNIDPESAEVLLLYFGFRYFSDSNMYLFVPYINQTNKEYWA